MKKIFVLFALLLVFVGVLYSQSGGEYPQLKDGDLVFQTSTSNQSSAIFVATSNLYTHTGIIKIYDKEIMVIEAASTVKETSLQDWINRGLLKRVAIYRNTNLTQEQIKNILMAAKRLYGKSYDIFFSFNNDSIYCSELPYLAYNSAGLSIGKIQKISDLNFDNYLVKKLIEQRWQKHSECITKKYDFEQCYKHILNQELVTPASIANDKQFTKIYSNYSW